MSAARPVSRTFEEDLRRLAEECRPVGHYRLARLDALLGGVRRGLIVVAGEPGAGKTTLTGQILDGFVADGGVGVSIQVEMSRPSAVARSLARLSSGRLGLGDFSGDLDAERASALEEASRRYLSEVAPRLTVHEGRISTDGIRALVPDLPEGAPPLMLEVDYLQIVDAPEHLRTDDERLAVKRVATELKRISVECRAPVVCISTINRPGYGRGEAGLGSLGGSSAIEYTADVVACLRAEPAAKGRPAPASGASGERRMRLDVVKNRFGPCGSVPLLYDAAHATFREAPEEG